MLKISTKNYFYYKHSKFGRIKFRQINLTDLIKLDNYKVIGKRHRDFTIFVLHNQIVSPKISISDFMVLDNREITSIAKYFIKETAIFAKYFKETKDESFFINFYNSYKNYRKELSKSFVPLRKAIAQMSKRFSETLSMMQINIAPITEYLNKFSRELGKSLQKIAIAADDAGRILEKYGWLIPPSIDIRVATLISNLGNKPGDHRKMINKILWDYYKRDNFKEIELMINGWKSNKLFERRIKILKDCLKTLQLSKEIGISSAANVIIPTLIAQIDGLWTDYAISKGFDITEFQKGEVVKELNKYKKKIITELKISGSFIKFDDLFKNMILETLWGITYPGIGAKTGYIFTRFYRNKIMHGEYISYGNRYNVLRAFFLLDYISELNKYFNTIHQ